MIFFTADTHFDHANIMRYCRRPFQSVSEMNDIFIHNINQRVKSTDWLYHLGDWSFCRDRRDRTNNAYEFRKKISCQNIFIILGNHDPHFQNGTPRPEFTEIFSGCQQMYRLKVDGYDYKEHKREIILSHYAMRVWNKSHYGAWHLYGHSHYTLEDDINSLSLDIGVDAVAGRSTGHTWQHMEEKQLFYDLEPENYTPIRLDEVATLMAFKRFKPIDHHSDKS